MHDGAPAHFTRAVQDVPNIMTDGQAEEDPLHGLHAHRIWILWIFRCGDT
jgi:hypothetical protein